MENIENKCPGCGKNDSIDKHSCPYKLKIDKSPAKCKCCEKCIADCAEDIYTINMRKKEKCVA